MTNTIPEVPAGVEGADRRRCLGGAGNCRRAGQGPIAVGQCLDRAPAQPDVLDLGRPDRAVRGDGRRSRSCSPTRTRTSPISAKARAAAQLRGLVRLRQPGLRRLRPDHLRRPGLDPGRDARHPVHPGLRLRRWASSPDSSAVWVDCGAVSRIGDIFFAIPLLLGGILVLYTFPSDLETPYIVVVLQGRHRAGDRRLAAIMARLMRSSVLQVKPNDYVQAARALGATPIPDHHAPTSCPTRWPR